MATALINGGTYRTRKKNLFVIVMLGDSRWGMLNLCRHVIHGMTSPLFQSDSTGKFAFTKKELEEKWNFGNWKLLDGRLRIEKIDEMGLTEYPTDPLYEIESPFLLKEIEQNKVS